jgi:Glycosyltransferase family 87
MNKNTRWIILAQIFLWAMALLGVAWLWDHWMLVGPHGPYRWVGMDFAPFWVGVREMFHGINPYSPETTLKIQELVYGGPALGADPMMFVYPAWLFAPIASFSLMPYKWAAIIYTGTLLWALLNFLFILSSKLGKGNFLKQSLWLAWLILGSLPFLVISVTKGQLGYLSLLALFLAYQLRKQKPLVAGILLGFALIKPTVTVIPVAGFLLWTLLQKDWKFLSGFAGCMATLLIASLLAVGNWLPDYFKMLGTKGGMPASWSLEILMRPWNILYAGFFIGMVAFAFYWSHKKNRDYWFPAVILAGIALTPMRWIYDLYLGILILVDEKDLSPYQSIIAGIAIISPWFLVLVPEEMRGNAAVIGLPLIWAVTLLVLVLPENLNAKVKTNGEVTNL